MNNQFDRLKRLTTDDGYKLIKRTSVIIIGLGGVGSWCAESLIRSGIESLTIVDSDTICETNINRQVQATTKTVGENKATTLKNRLHEINPNANVTAITKRYNSDTADEFDFSKFNYTIDAIDSLSSKVELLTNATKSTTTLFSSLGAALKLDPSRIKTASIWETKGCRLGRFVRKRLRRRGVTKNFTAVYSDEQLPSTQSLEATTSTERVNGSIIHITAIFGFTLSSLIINDILKNCDNLKPLY